MDLNKYRLSLQFSSKSEDHVKVLKLLKKLGRKKSEFITWCVLDYLENEDDFDLTELQKELGTSGYYKRDRRNKRKQSSVNNSSEEKQKQVDKSKEEEKDKSKGKKRNTEVNDEVKEKPKNNHNKKNFEKENTDLDDVPIDIEEELPEIPDMFSEESDKDVDAYQEPKADNESNSKEDNADVLLEGVKAFGI